MDTRFRDFALSKAHAAESARYLPFTTVENHAAGFPVESIGCEFTSALLDGPFFESRIAPGAAPLVNLVFVQSRDGNTGADDPSTLGGGDTDQHVIYEGLSRVGADAVMAGASTIRDGDVIFSVWHPRLVALRESLAKPRHPIQVVVTRSGSLPIEGGLLFNVPEIHVVIVTAESTAPELARRTRTRPWISVVSSSRGLRPVLGRLRGEFALERISAVGGRRLATSLIDQALVSDLYLTTSARDGGRPGTPMYEGNTPPHRELVIRKQSTDGTLFEHWLLK